MEKSKSTILLISSILVSFLGVISAQTCGSYRFTNNKVYTTCQDLPYLSSFLHWTYDSSNGTLDLAFRYTAATESSWISWAINPTGTGMIGAQSLVAYRNSSGGMRAYTSSIDSFQTTLAESSLSFNVSSITAAFSGSEMTIFATLELTSGTTTINQVWQEGPMSSDTPGTHSTSGNNVLSKGTLDLQSGAATTTGNSRQRRRNVHGVLNAVSWGTLMPLGAIIARYLKVFHDPAWFYLHISCQTSAYVVGVAGWATGLKLGSDSSANNKVHGNIGIVLFTLGTLQVFALLLRPKKDHKYRLYWNIYHHLTGYTVIILSIVNVFKGLDILDPEEKWKRAYIGILIFYGACVVILEPLTWYIVLTRKKASGSDKFSHSMNGRANGHGNGITRDEV